VTELEEAHEAIGALLRLNDSAAWQKQLEQKDAELASLRAELRAATAQALPLPLVRVRVRVRVRVSRGYEPRPRRLYP
jgi:hypothetical protein